MEKGPRKICHDFYKELYRHNDISNEALREVFEGFPITFMNAMNATLARDIIEKDLSSMVMSMAKGKTSGL